MLLFFPLLQCYTQAIFKDTTCGFSLTLPKHWTIKEVKRPDVCYFSLKYPAWDTIALKLKWGSHIIKYPIEIKLEKGSIKKNGVNYACFNENGIWWIGGLRGALQKARFISNSFWDAVIGKSEVAIQSKNDIGYPGTKFVFVTLLDNRHGRFVSIVSNYHFNDETTFNKIVNSIRF